MSAGPPGAVMDDGIRFHEAGEEGRGRDRAVCVQGHQLVDAREVVPRSYGDDVSGRIILEEMLRIALASI